MAKVALFSVNSFWCPFQSRYARFLKLYVDLYHREKYLREERMDPNADRELKEMVMNIKTDPEDYFGVERCLKCIDAGVRKEVIENVKKVKKGQSQPGAWVYQPAYPIVLDKLNNFLGTYNEVRQLQSLRDQSTWIGCAKR